MIINSSRNWTMYQNEPSIVVEQKENVSKETKSLDNKKTVTSASNKWTRTNTVKPKKLELTKEEKKLDKVDDSNNKKIVLLENELDRVEEKISNEEEIILLDDILEEQSDFEE